MTLPTQAMSRFGLFFLVTGTLTLYIAAQILQIDFGDRYRITGVFDDVTGLLEGDQVKIAGAPVGRVDGIGVEDGRAVVTLRIDDGIRVPEDSEISIRWRNAIGQRMVYLEPGDSRKMLADGARVTRTRSVVDLSTVVNGLGPLTRSLDPAQINRLLTAFSQAIDGNQGNIARIADDLDTLLAAFASRQGTIGQMVKDYRTVFEALGRRDRQIAQVVDDLATLTQAFADSRGVLDEALVEVSRTARDLDVVLGGDERRVGRLIDNAAELAETARLNVDSLTKVLDGLPPALRALFSATDEGDYIRLTAPCIKFDDGPCPYDPVLPPARDLRSMMLGGE
ncbi:MCE family protein [Actinocorallia populi]|uniref:MCE family protein n=1 Tax=Actinocorallia populi TaxID=2079200 RepID=UPI000D08AA0C|nr:MlaD family protein [Actinocorallia populi]